MTPNWDLLIDAASVATVLPAEHAGVARPVAEALCVFLNGLPDSQQAAMLQAQAALPRDATMARRLGVLAGSSPVLQKLGQVLARDRRLPAELRGYLRALESLPPSVPIPVIERLLSRELGPLGDRGIRLQEPALAEASVAVVVPFLQDPRADGSGIARGVFKLLKPGIEQQLERELRLLERVGEHLDAGCTAMEIPPLDYEETFRQINRKLLDEVQLQHEQRHLALAAEFYADEGTVHIPALLGHCTPRVTAMERIDGCKVTDILNGNSGRRRWLARQIARTLIARPIFSRQERAIFHGDPHAGNLLFTSAGRLAILDWSLAGRLGNRDRDAIVQLLLAALTLDGQRVARVLASFAVPGQGDSAALADVADAGVRRLRHGGFPGFRWLIRLLDDAVNRAGLRVGTDMMLFRKSLHTLDGVITDVGDSAGQIQRTLTLEFLRHFAAEWPQRWYERPQSREFSTRLSNLDVTGVLLSGPATLARFWTGHAMDILDTGSGWRRSGTQPRPANPASSSSNTEDMQTGSRS